MNEYVLIHYQVLVKSYKVNKWWSKWSSWLPLNHCKRVRCNTRITAPVEAQINENHVKNMNYGISLKASVDDLINMHCNLLS